MTDASGAENKPDKADDQVARSYRERRVARGDWSYRDVERATKGLAEQFPELYEGVSRLLPHQLDQEGAAFFQKTRDLRKMRALIHAVWGDDESFERETGVAVPYPRAQDAAALRPVPLHREGARVRAEELTRVDGVVLRSPDLPGADFLVEVTGESLFPVVSPGQTVGVKQTGQARLGDLCALVVNEKLQLAYRTGLNAYHAPSIREGASRKYSLGKNDRLLGPVAWISRPSIQVEGRDDLGEEPAVRSA